MNFVKEFDRIDKLIKLIITFFLDPIFGAIYRLLRGRIIWGVLWFVTAGLFGVGGLIDFITVLTDNKYTLFV